MSNQTEFLASTTIDETQEKLNKQKTVKLEKRFRHHVGKAISDYNMIEDGDKVMVCLSGGADSYTMLDILLKLKASAPIHFDIIAINLDQKQPGFPEHILPDYLKSLGVDYHIIEEDTYSIVKDKIPEGKTTCSLCSRLRRGILYSTAKRLHVTKIALGHHRDDMIETLLLNMFFNGKTKTMPAKLVSDNGEHVVIRPLAYCKEVEIKQYSQLKQFPIIPCNLCGSQPNLQRQNVKQMLREWDKQFPGRAESIFTAMQNVVPSHLADHQLFNFKDVDLNSGVINGGDIAFDKEPISEAIQVNQQFKNIDPVNIIEIK